MSISHLLNEYFRFPLGSKVLITTRHGGWVILSEEEERLLKSKEIEEGSDLFKRLEGAGIILTKEGRKGVIGFLRGENGFLFFPTNYHVIAITDACNFNCLYCHPDARPGKLAMTKEIAEKILDFIFSIPMIGGCQIVIEGGEPLLQWDLIKFIFNEARERTKEKNLKFKFSFTTNLSLMNDEIAKDLSEMGINPCASLDGPRELHNRHRPFLDGGGSYDKVIYWIKKLREEYKVKINAIPVITNLSLKYGPEAIIDEYLKLGLDSIYLKPFRPTGRALLNLKELEMRAEDFFEFWRRGIEYCLSLNKKGVKISELNAEYFIGNILTPYRRSMCHRRPCGAGISILSYHPDGTINACDATRSVSALRLGHVLKDDYPTIRSRALPLLALTPDLVPICSSCPFVAYCSNCLAENFGKDNSLYPKVPRSFSCHWQMMAFEYLFKKFAENKEEAEILRKWIETPR